MEHLTQAIREAVEKGGYEIDKFFGPDAIYARGRMPDGGDELKYWLVSDTGVHLDPAFWQALGKVRGWKCVIDFEYEEGSLGEEEKPHFDHVAGQMPQWLYEQHRLIDHLAEGKDIESFFAALHPVKEVC